MKRTQKIVQLWQALTKPKDLHYPPANVNKDADCKKKITAGLKDLHARAKPNLTEQTPEGQQLLQRRDRLGVTMRNFCRSLKKIHNKAYFKRIKGLTAVVMSLTLASLDSEDGLGSEASLDRINTAAVDSKMDAADEVEVEETVTGAATPATSTTIPATAKPVSEQPARTWASAAPTSAVKSGAAEGLPNAAMAQAVQPPARPANDAPQILPPKILRERSEAAMKLARSEHNLDRKQKLAKLAQPGVSFLGSGIASRLGNLKSVSGPEFKEVVNCIAACEKNATAANLLTLEQAAQRYLKHYEKYGPLDKLNPDNTSKKKICEAALKAAPLAACSATLKELGPAEHWGLREENQAGSVYAKALFETGNAQASPNASGGAMGSWWVEKQVEDNKPKKKFIFKPADKEGAITGFPMGGSACREVLGKAAAQSLQALTGLDFQAPETLLVNVAKDRLAGFKDEAPETSHTVGSMQHFSKSGGEIGDKLAKDPAFAKRIPKEECQKMAVLDLVTLNMDRHAGNFLVHEENDGKASLIPIDHGLVLPSRDGLRQRNARMGPPFTALSKIPAAEEPFTPEMAARVAAIDPDAVVKGLQEAQEVMQQQFPDVAGKADIKEENYALVKRSCQFLKKAVAEGLSPAELSDAYLRHQDAIFDTPADGAEGAFATVIQDVKARSPLRQQAMQAMPTPEACLPVASDLVALGWDVPNLSAESSELGNLHQLLLSNPVLFDSRQKKVVNPSIEKEIAELQDRCKGLGFSTPRRLPNSTPTGYLKVLELAIETGMKKKAEEEAKALPGGKFSTSEATDVYAMFLADGGAQKLQEQGVDLTQRNPAEKLGAFMDAAEKGWAASGVATRFKEQCPDLVTNPPVVKVKDKPTEAEAKELLAWRCMQYKALRIWEEFEQEGGSRAYGQLGCDKSIPMGPTASQRLKELRRAKKLQAQLATLPATAPATAAPTEAKPDKASNEQQLQRVKTLVHGVNKKINTLEPTRKMRASQQLMQAIRLSQSNLGQSLELLNHLEQELAASAAQ